MHHEYPKLFEPIRIGKVEIKNRYSMAPMGPIGFSDINGAFSQQGIEYYVERAKGGTGLIITGVCMVENEIEQFLMPSIPLVTKVPHMFLLSSKLMNERVHAYDTKIFAQLTLGWGRASMPHILVDPSRHAVAPSPVENRWDPSIKHRALTTEEVETYVKKCAASAFIAQQAGFDGVEIHAVHEGYLLDQFAMALFNQRTDRYGGNLEGRLRFAVEIVQAIKSVCGAGFPVSVRFSLKSFIKGLRQGALPGEDFEELGRDIEEGLAAARILADAGYDALNVDAGTYDSWYWNHPPMYFEDGMYLPFAQQLKAAVEIPIITAGRMDDPDLAEAAIRDGKTDLIGLGRPLLADAHLPEKVRKGLKAKIRPCLSCQEGCIARVSKPCPLSCAVNPACGREVDYAVTPATVRKKVAIAGGGVAGMEAARVCGLRGHTVDLYEKSDHLGGNLVPGGVPDFKIHDRKLIAWYEQELADLEVRVHLNQAADRQTLAQADTVIVATGSQPLALQLPGMEADHVRTAAAVLLDESLAGDNVVIIGGGLVGCETALWLAQKGRQVTVVELLPEILGGPHGICFANYDMLTDLLDYHRVRIMTSTSIKAVTPGGVSVASPAGDGVLPADTVIVAVGYRPEKTLFAELVDDPRDIHLLGDARDVQNIMHAVWEAYELGRNI